MKKKGIPASELYSRLEPINVFKGLGLEEFDREGRAMIAEFEDFFFWLTATSQMFKKVSSALSTVWHLEMP